MQVRFGKDEHGEGLSATAQRMLQAFAVSKVATPAGRILAVEETLRGPLIAGLPDLLGRVDLILETDQELIISDWKTGRSRWTEQQVEESSEQLLLYSELARDLAPRKKLRLDFTVLTKTKPVAIDQHLATVDSQRIERTKRMVQRVWQAIDSGHFYPSPSPMACPSCPFQDPCHQWRG